MSALAAVLTVEQLWLPAPGGSGTYIEHLIRALARRSDVEVTGLSAWHGSTARVPVPVRRWPLPHRATDLV
ncbi:MAG TPA: hypothetical protein PKB06_09250 [Actinotalea sp.]|nr:hypothetical protein [Actinotalea sp.]